MLQLLTGLMQESLATPWPPTLASWNSHWRYVSRSDGGSSLVSGNSASL